MEIKSLKNGIVPELLENDNWNWFFDKISELPKDTLFSLLREGEQPFRITLPVEKLVTDKFETDNSTVISGKFIQVNCNCHNGTDAFTDQIYVSVNGTNVTTGHYVTYTYNASTGYLERTDYYNEALYFRRGTNTLMFDASTLELIEMLWVDTYAITGTASTDLNEQACDAVANWIEEYRHNRPNTICVLLNADSASCSAKLRKTLASLGGLKEGVYSSARKRHYFIGNLNTPGQKAFEQISDDPSFEVVTVPCKDGVYKNTEKPPFDDIRVLYSLGTIAGPTEMFIPKYSPPENNVLSNCLWAKIVANVVDSDPILVRMYSSTWSSLNSATYTFAVSNSKGGPLLEYPNISCAAIAAYTEGNLYLRLKEANKTSAATVLCSRTLFNRAVFSDEYYLQDGEYKSDSGYIFDVKDGSAVSIPTVSTEVVIEKFDYFPNMFKGVYGEIFGTRIFDIFSYTGLSTAQYLLGYPEHDLETGTAITQFITEATPYQSGKKYSIRGIKFLSRTSAYISEDCLPYEDDDNCDFIEGQLSYCTDASVSSCTFKNVSLKVLSYDKGIIFFDGSTEDLDFVEECASLRAYSVKSRAVLVRKLHGYQFDEPIVSFDVAKPASDPNKYIELKNWWERSEPIAALLKNIQYTLAVSTTLIEAQRQGDPKFVVSIFGNDEFTIVTTNSWLTVTTTGIAPSDIFIAVATNETSSARTGEIQVQGRHGTRYTIVVKQDYLETTKPTIIGGPIFASAGGTFKMIIRTAVAWKVTAPDWITIQRTGTGSVTLDGQVQPYDTSVDQDYATRQGKIYFETVDPDNSFPKTEIVEFIQQPKLTFEVRCGYPQGSSSVIAGKDKDPVRFSVKTHPNIHWIVCGVNDVTSDNEHFSTEDALVSLWPCRFQTGGIAPAPWEPAIPKGWMYSDYQRDPIGYWPCSTIASQVESVSGTAGKFSDGSRPQYLPDTLSGKGSTPDNVLNVIYWRAPQWSQNNPITPRVAILVGKFDDATATTLELNTVGAVKNIRTEDLHQYASKWSEIKSYNFIECKPAVRSINI